MCIIKNFLGKLSTIHKSKMHDFIMKWMNKQTIEKPFFLGVQNTVKYMRNTLEICWVYNCLSAVEAAKAKGEFVINALRLSPSVDLNATIRDAAALK